jgi:hypothetical protein
MPYAAVALLHELAEGPHAMGRHNLAVALEAHVDAVEWKWAAGC